MVAPYVPTPLATPLVNPAVGSTGTPPIPYLSNAEYIAAPTAMNSSDLRPGGTTAQQAQSLADVIRRATRWADSICFGADASDKGASLAASLSVDSALVRIKRGQLRLICDYRPIIEVVGIATGSGLGNLSSIDPTLASLASIGRRTITLPYSGPVAVNRTGDLPAVLPGGVGVTSVYAVWSYVNGYPHTSLAAAVAAGATSCVVNAVDGAGGLWGVYGASGAFPGTQLAVIDGQYTERVFVKAVTAATPTASQTTLTTSAFAYDHSIPAPPDFVPVTAVPEDVHQAVISLATMLIKTRGVRGLVMPVTPGGRPSQATKEKLGQAGALEDYEIARTLLAGGGYVVRQKHPGSY